MLKRLNGWQRIGVVASILWALYGANWGNNIGLQEGDWVSAAYSDCMNQPAPVDFKACSDRFDKAWPAAIHNHWLYAALFAFVPIPLGWLAVYGIIGLVRWIRNGFKASTG